MLALWGALKSVIRPGERVLAVATGIFGYGIGEMARQIGAGVEVVWGAQAAATAPTTATDDSFKNSRLIIFRDMVSSLDYLNG